jgi:acetolactate synthase I/II/III large subunit
MPRLTGGEAIVQSLIAHGVDTVFGLPGVQNDWLYNAFYDARDQIRLIHTRHEQGAAYMALGYAQSTGRAGVYSVVPGPGVLNTTAALCTAYATNDKVFCLTGQIASTSIGKGYGLLHEIPDQLGILRSLTKWAERVNSPVAAPGMVAEAFKQLHTGRPRPVALEVPPDVLSARTTVEIPPATQTYAASPVDPDSINEAAKLLAGAKNPLIFVGSGAIGAAEAVRELAEVLQAPVVANRSGNGILSNRHPLSLRMPAAYLLWEQADVVIAIGSRMQWALQTWGVDPKLKLIRIDIDPTEHARIVTPVLSITARSEAAVPALVEAVSKLANVRPSRYNEMDALKAEVEGRYAALQPQYGFLQAIRAELPDDGIFVEEMTQVGYVSRFALPVYEPRTYITCGYQGTLGWGFATALGVKVAHPDRAVLSVNGDGGFLFTVQELATAVQHRINTVTLVFNDGAFGNVRRMQKLNYDQRLIASDLQNPDFVKLAEAFGALGLRAHTPDDLRQAIRRGFAADVPTLIEIPVGEMPSPWPLVYVPRVRAA